MFNYKYFTSPLPFLRVHGDAARAVQIIPDDEFVRLRGGVQGRHHDPVVQRVRPVQIIGQPVHGQTLHDRRRPREQRLCLRGAVQT